MDMYQKRKMRQEKKKNNTNDTGVAKMSINWERYIYAKHTTKPYFTGLLQNG